MSHQLEPLELQTSGFQAWAHRSEGWDPIHGPLVPLPLQGPGRQRYNHLLIRGSSNRAQGQWLVAGLSSKCAVFPQYFFNRHGSLCFVSPCLEHMVPSFLLLSGLRVSSCTLHGSSIPLMGSGPVYFFP